MRSLRTFEAHTGILPPAQRRLWPDLQSTPEQFTLYGGTALALRLSHRKSVDFDFFAGALVDGSELLESVPYLRGAKVRRLEPNTLTCSVRRGTAVRVSFFGGLTLRRVDPPDTARGPMIKVASLRDIAATKVSVIMKRAEVKDYIDIHALIAQAGLSLAEMLGCAQAVYGSAFEPLVALKALAYHDDPGLAALPKSVRVDLLRSIRDTDPNRLPRIKAVPLLKRKR